MAVAETRGRIIKVMKLYPWQAETEVSDNCAFNPAFAPVWTTNVVILGELVDPFLLNFVAIDTVWVRGPGTLGRWQGRRSGSRRAGGGTNGRGRWTGRRETGGNKTRASSRRELFSRPGRVLIQR